jgi:hypothetical protein
MAGTLNPIVRNLRLGINWIGGLRQLSSRAGACMRVSRARQRESQDWSVQAERRAWSELQGGPMAPSTPAHVLLAHSHPMKSSIRCDFRHTHLARWNIEIERLITRTALSRHLHDRRSVQRFERDTYHGDALPTELRGRVLSCLTWGFAPYSGQLRSCTAVLPHRAPPRSGARTLPA